MKTSLTDALFQIEEHSNGNSKITFADIVEALNSRGFGALLIGPALITILPTGAIPGIPALCAVLIMLFSVQILLGRDYPWLPKRLENISFDAQAYKRGVKKIKPYIQWIDSFFHPRFEVLTGHTADICVAIICILLSCLIIAFGFIPFMPMLPAFAVLMLALGLSVHDGLLVACGFVITISAFIILPMAVL